MVSVLKHTGSCLEPKMGRDTCPPSPATWEGTEGGRVYLAPSFPKRVLGQMAPFPFCGPCSSLTPKFWGSGRVGNKPPIGKLPKPTVTPLGTDQGPAARVRLCLSSCSKKVQPDSWHHQPFRNHSTPCPAFPPGAGHPFLFPLQGAAQPLRPGSPLL